MRKSKRYQTQTEVKTYSHNSKRTSYRECNNKVKDRSSYKEHTENALASGDDEGRDKLRKAAGRSKYPLIRRYPNGETHYSNTVVPYNEFIVIRR